MLLKIYNYYSYNHRGDVVLVIDANADTTATYEYTAFGEPIAPSDNLPERFIGFSSKEYDIKSGLSYYGFRYYDPSSTRWMKKDPIGFSGGINLYGFVGNNAINLYDKYGLGVYGVQGNIGAGGAVGGEVSVLLARDSMCNYAVLETFGGGPFAGVGINAGGGPLLASGDVDSMLGYGFSLGGSLSILRDPTGVLGLSAGGDATWSPSKNTFLFEATVGISVSASWAGIGEGHNFHNYTIPIKRKNFADKNGCCGIKERAKGHLWLTTQMSLREKWGVVGTFIADML